MLLPYHVLRENKLYTSALHVHHFSQVKGQRDSTIGKGLLYTSALWHSTCFYLTLVTGEPAQNKHAQCAYALHQLGIKRTGLRFQFVHKAHNYCSSTRAHYTCSKPMLYTSALHVL